MAGVPGDHALIATEALGVQGSVRQRFSPRWKPEEPQAVYEQAASLVRSNCQLLVSSGTHDVLGELRERANLQDNTLPEEFDDFGSR